MYSDLGFILCAWICQRAGMAVDELAAPQGFLIPSGADLERCIPTGYDPDQMPLTGRVHDPTCRRAGGRNCGHAGWFGGIEATTAAVRSWLDLACGRPSSVPRAASALIVPQHGGRTANDVPTPGGTTGGGWGARLWTPRLHRDRFGSTQTPTAPPCCSPTAPGGRSGPRHRALRRHFLVRSHGASAGGRGGRRPQSR